MKDALVQETKQAIEVAEKTRPQKQEGKTPARIPGDTKESSSVLLHEFQELDGKDREWSDVDAPRKASRVASL